jgi:hypothetical protein
VANNKESAPFQWLACVATLPTDDPAARMRVLRTLESLGCAVVRDGVYLLPNTLANRQGLSRLCEHIGKINGSAFLLHVVAADDQQAAVFRTLFDRTGKYESLLVTIAGLKAGFGMADPAAIARVLAKQRREFEAIQSLDFFPSQARARTASALQEAEQQVRSLLFPAGPESDNVIDPGRAYSQCTWATRRPLWADRLACAWLIRRFIDPEAKLVWLEKAEVAPQGVIAFGYEGAKFSNGQSEITFERLLKSFALGSNPCLTRMAALVHYLEAGGTPVAEGAGVETLLHGAKRRTRNDDDLLSESEKTFDLLYDAYLETAAKYTPRN